MPEESEPKQAKRMKPPCGVPLRNKPGKFCQSRFTYPNGRCKLHNGNALKGLAHPRTKTGYLSKCLPVRMLSRMEEFQSDEQLMSLHTDIAFIAARIEDVLERVSQANESESVWRKLLSLKAEVYNAKSDEERADKMRLLLSTIDRAEKTIADYDEVHKLLEQRRKFVESETTRKLKLSANVTLDAVNVLFLALATAVREEVDDVNKLNSIFNRFDAINQRNNAPLLVPASDDDE